MSNFVSWKDAIRSEWVLRQSAKQAESQEKSLFPLIAQGFEEEEIVNLVDTILSGQLTMSSQVKKFEQEFAKFLNVPFAVMVNSGSSANLLAFAVACNPMRRQSLKFGDEVLISAVCWSTSLWPIVQMGLKPVFVDADPVTLNVDLEDAKRKITPRTKALLGVHILGNSAPMAELESFVEKNRLLLLEDTCESLGSKANGKFLGTFGAMGTYSFYYSHHMTTGEGGMVVCHTQEDVDLLRCLRAHGWSRELSDKTSYEATSPDIDPRFLFVNLGYNLRPMETQASFGLTQLQKLDRMNANRIENRSRILKGLTNHPQWRGQFQFPESPEGTDAVWFGFPALLAPKYVSQHGEFLSYLSTCGVENRPIVSGNFARQPALKLFGINVDPSTFPGAELINRAGFFVGLHTEPLNPDMVNSLVEILMGFQFNE